MRLATLPSSSARLACAAALLAFTAVVGCKPSTEAKPAAEAKQAPAGTVVVMKTNKGTVEIELYPDKAPETVKNFLEYVDSGAYDGTIFHRVIAQFMIQGGGFTSDGQQKPSRAAIRNEAGNGLKNLRGTIAMARTQVVDSASNQFFINHKDNAFLDHTNDTPQGFGYCVFGKVISGMDVVDAIANSPKGPNPPGVFSDRPKDDVVIESIKRKG